MALPHSQTSSEAYTSFFQRQLQLAGGFEATLQNRFRIPTDSDLRGRVGLLAISVRNPRFSNDLVAAFCRTAVERFAGGVITVVDRPYEHNVAARCGTPEERRREIETLRRIAVQTRARVARIVAQHGDTISVESWEALANEVPGWLTQGIRAAWERRGRFYVDVLAQTATVLPNTPAPYALERYAEFLLEELPVLLHRYYCCPEEVVDVYPGQQPAMFWRIEAGAYADEMPEVARLLCARAGLIYAHVGVRIRQMRPSELEAVMTVWRRSTEQVEPRPEGRTNGTAQEDQRRFLDSIGRGNDVWVAVEDGQVLGFLAISGSQVNYLSVDPMARCRGVGTALLKRAKILSPEGVRVFAHERNQLARAFCMQRGFREVRLVGTVLGYGPQVEFAWKPDPAADPPVLSV